MQARAHLPHPSQRSKSMAIPKRTSADGNFGCAPGISTATKFSGKGFCLRTASISFSYKEISSAAAESFFSFFGAFRFLRQPKSESAARVPPKSFKNAARESFTGDTSHNPSKPLEIRVLRGGRRGSLPSGLWACIRCRSAHAFRDKSRKKLRLSHAAREETRRSTAKAPQNGTAFPELRAKRCRAFHRLRTR